MTTEILDAKLRSAPAPSTTAASTVTFESSRIFLDKRVFQIAHVPEHILHRETQTGIIEHTLADLDINVLPRNMVCVGDFGTGKTATMRHICSKLPHDCRVVYVNCSDANTQTRIMRTMLPQLGTPVKRGFGPDYYHDLLKQQLPTFRYVILILDEVDQFLEHEDSEFDAFFYSLSRIFTNVCTILLTNRVSIEQLLLDKLDSRTRDTFRLKRIDFTDYDPVELGDILEDRCRIGLRQNSYDKGTIAQIALISYNRGLRGRGIIDITRKAGEIAEDKGHDRITKDDVWEASSEDEDLKIVRCLPPIHKAILNQILIESPTLGRLYDPWFLAIPKGYNVGKSYSTLRGYVQELDTLGLIEKETHGRGRGRSTETRLKVPTPIAAIVKRSLVDTPPSSPANVTPGDQPQ